MFAKKPRKLALWATAFPDQHNQLTRPAVEARQSRQVGAEARRRSQNQRQRLNRSNSTSTKPSGGRRIKFVSPMSAKRRAESKQYSVMRLKFIRAHPFCERPGCGKKSECVHHWAGRRDNYLKVETWKGSCNACNDYAKNHPKEARAEGWIAPVNVYKV